MKNPRKSSLLRKGLVLLLLPVIVGCGPGSFPPKTAFQVSNSLYDNAPLTCLGGIEASLIFPSKTYSLKAEISQVNSLPFDKNLIEAGGVVIVKASCKLSTGVVSSSSTKSGVIPKNFEEGDFGPLYGVAVFTPMTSQDVLRYKCNDDLDSTKVAPCISVANLGFDN